MEKYFLNVSSKKGISLSPKVYNWYQNFVHKNYQQAFKIILKLLQLRSGETVLEVGCGTGLLAANFVNNKYNYCGIDVDPGRIAIAKEQLPDGNFLTWDALDLENADLPAFRCVFIHGILHHLNDSDCRYLIKKILSFNPNVTLVVIEPFFPDKWWVQPLQALIARLDEGSYVRAQQEWINLFKPHIDNFTTYSLKPRFPLSLIALKLKNIQ